MYMYYLLGHKLMELPVSPEKKIALAENTFLLTLDGDTDFQPKAVHLLLDLMKKNPNLGAASGRLHPTGSGQNSKFKDSISTKIRLFVLF
jgi:chitin synthase